MASPRIGEVRDNTLPPEHIGQIPAGHSRDEENRKRTDTLAQKAEETAAPFEGINEQKFRQQDNEIVGQIQRDQRSGTWIKPIVNKQAGYLYAWLKNPATCQMVEAEMAVDTMVNAFFAIGGEWVEGDPKYGGMPENPDDIGKGKATPGTRRGWGDTNLARIKIMFWEAAQKAQREREIRRGMVEQNLINQMQSMGYTGTANPADPRFGRSAANPGAFIPREVVYTSEGVVRDAQSGNLMEPGFERR